MRGIWTPTFVGATTVGGAVIAVVHGEDKCGAGCEDVGLAPAAFGEGRGTLSDAINPMSLDR